VTPGPLYLDVCTRAVWKVHGLILLLRAGTLWRCDDGLFFEVPPLASDALLTTLHPLLENVLQRVCRKLKEERRSSVFMVGKAQKSHGTRSGLYGGCSDGVPPISVTASIATFQSRNADAPLRLPHHPKKGSFKTTETPFSRSGWSVVRSALLTKVGTSKKRPLSHLHKVPTRSNKVSSRTLQTTFVNFLYNRTLNVYCQGSRIVQLV
jgi:hypothetical protein